MILFLNIKKTLRQTIDDGMTLFQIIRYSFLTHLNYEKIFQQIR